MMVQLTTQQAFERLLFRDADGRYCARFADYRLQSVFQPLFYRSGSIFGYEALLRVYDPQGRQLRPDLFFHSLDTDDQIDADRLSRVLHFRNFAQARVAGCLNLNLIPNTLLHDKGYGNNFGLMTRRCGELGLETSQVILEVLEYEIEQSPLQLAGSLREAKAAGFGVALDDFGAVSSSQGRVKALCPDIIKIDRSLLLDYMQGDNGRLQRVLEQGWQIGSRMLIEGVETAEQLAAMQALGLELYQGFYLGMPAELRVEELV
ncbi:EAL domain-containing protein [Vogesella sp. DC21W]|uniref:EAL domain-containing protein n=1 Tax=Vogesella aquatica TaxID=2984206 RepID=A0ABT5IUY1_9NEIS|nr:EAL domain-containing protein [Vogesella aquatica]MDC7716378.1 EAL domain-containing protein [Vogesella aquatica]